MYNDEESRRSHIYIIYIIYICDYISYLECISLIGGRERGLWRAPAARRCRRPACGRPRWAGSPRAPWRPRSRRRCRSWPRPPKERKKNVSRSQEISFQKRDDIYIIWFKYNTQHDIYIWLIWLIYDLNILIQIYIYTKNIYVDVFVSSLHSRYVDLSLSLSLCAWPL